MTRYPYQYPFQSDREPRGSHVGWLIVILLVLLISFLLIWAPRGLRKPAGLVLPAAATDYTANPELAAFYRFPAYIKQQTDLARNPELAAMRRFEYEQAAIDAAALRNSNPLERFYFTVHPGDDYLDSAFLSRNPEIALFNNYVAARR